MGWGNCGEDSQGRPIGYCHPATCDHPGCDKEIDRGLAYVCGDMHGEDEFSCEKYFCDAHRICVEIDYPTPSSDTICTSVCQECVKLLKEEMEYDPYEDIYSFKE